MASWSGVAVATTSNTPEEAALMRAHMTEDDCQRCNHLAKSPKVQELVTTLKAGGTSPEQVRLLVEAHTVNGTLPGADQRHLAETESPMFSG